MDDNELTFNFLKGPFPEKIVLQRLFTTFDDPKTEELYFKRVYCYAIVQMYDEDNVVGSCICSNCNNSLGLFEKFCPHCGAKIQGKKILDKDGNEID